MHAQRTELLAFTRATFPGYQPNWHHRRLARFLDRLRAGEIKRGIVTMPPRHGKALALDTPIPTPKGWSTMGAMKRGDVVFDDQGKTCSVVAVSEVWRDREVFRVETDDGDSVIADAEHEWLVRLCRKRPKFKLKTTRYLASRKATRAAMTIAAGGLQLPRAALPIDPYVLGLWLGDGNSDSATITQGDEDRAFIRDQVERSGYRTTDRATHGTFGILNLRRPLRIHKLLKNKHIPEKYLRASSDQRLALLQGLVDTDGHVAPDGQIEFCSTDIGLANGVKELVASLGGKASIITGEAMLYGRYISPKYRVMFYMSGAARLPRKAERTRSGIRFDRRYLTITPAGRADTVCIQVDSPSHMFLCGRTMLPTHNSQLFSRQLPALALGMNPDERVLLGSYGDDLATAMSRDAKRIMEADAYMRLFPNTRTMTSGMKVKGKWVNRDDLFEIVGRRGYMRAVGIGGGLTGMGGTLGLIDDPIKNPKEAASPTIRESQWEWFTQVFMTRMEEDARVAMTLTRWHEDDLAGRQLELVKSGAVSIDWHVLNLPAIREAEGHPEDPRTLGEVLWPDRYGLTFMNEMKVTLGAQAFAAIYQQRPAPAEGGTVKRVWFAKRYKVVPSDARYAISADLAFDDGPNTSFIVLQVWAWKGSDIFLIKQVRRRMDFVETLFEFDALAKEYPQATMKLVEKKANGAALISMLKSKVQGIIAVNPRGSKMERLAACSPLMEAGNVWLPEPSAAPWIGDYIEELVTFPNAPNDDQVDATSQMLNRLRGETGTIVAPGSMTRESQFQS